MLADRKARFHQANASISPIPHIPPNRVNAGTPPTVHHPAQQQTNVRQSPTTDFANTKTPKLLSGRLAYAIELGNVHPPGAKLLQLYLFAFRLRSNRRSPLRVCGGETRLRSRRCLTDGDDSLRCTVRYREMTQPSFMHVRNNCIAAACSSPSDFGTTLRLINAACILMKTEPI